MYLIHTCINWTSVLRQWAAWTACCPMVKTGKERKEKKEEGSLLLCHKSYMVLCEVSLFMGDSDISLSPDVSAQWLCWYVHQHPVKVSFIFSVDSFKKKGCMSEKSGVICMKKQISTLLDFKLLTINLPSKSLVGVLPTSYCGKNRQPLTWFQLRASNYLVCLKSLQSVSLKATFCLVIKEGSLKKYFSETG